MHYIFIRNKTNVHAKRVNVSFNLRYISKFEMIKVISKTDSNISINFIQETENKPKKTAW